MGVIQCYMYACHVVLVSEIAIRKNKFSEWNLISYEGLRLYKLHFVAEIPREIDVLVLTLVY